MRDNFVNFSGGVFDWLAIVMSLSPFALLLVHICERRFDRRSTEDAQVQAIRLYETVAGTNVTPVYRKC